MSLVRRGAGRARSAVIAPPSALDAEKVAPVPAQLLQSSDDLFLMGSGNDIDFESPSVPRALGYSLIGCVCAAYAGGTSQHAALTRAAWAQAHPHG